MKSVLEYIVINEVGDVSASCTFTVTSLMTMYDCRETRTFWEQELRLDTRRHVPAKNEAVT